MSDSTGSEGVSEGLVEIALGIHLIFDKIWKYLQKEDILNCSLVNTFWSQRSRQYMWNLTKGKVRITSEKCAAACVTLKRLNDSFSNSSYIPFNGMDFCLYPGSYPISDYCSLRCIGDGGNVRELYSTLFDKFQFESVSIAWFERELKCPAARFIERILAEKSSQLITLEIQAMPLKVQSMWEHLNIQVNDRKDWLPSLKNLTVPFFNNMQSGIHHFNFNMISEIVTSAPKLESITGYVPPDIKRHSGIEFLTATYQIMKQNLFSRSSGPMEVLEEEPEVDAVSLDFTTSKLPGIKQLEKACCLLGKSSFNYLQNLYVTLPQLICIGTFNIPPLISMVHLVVSFSRSRSVTKDFMLLKVINFAQVFPQLLLVEADMRQSYSQSDNTVQVLDTFLSTPGVYTCETVNKLLVEDIGYPFSLEAIQEVFPNVSKLLYFKNCFL